jgi:hypothetical protein
VARCGRVWLDFISRGSRPSPQAIRAPRASVGSRVLTTAWICCTVRQFSSQSGFGAAQRRWRIAQGGAEGGTLGLKPAAEAVGLLCILVSALGALQIAQMGYPALEKARPGPGLARQSYRPSRARSVWGTVPTA